MFETLNKQCIPMEGVKDYALLMLDPQGRVVGWTASAERIKGYRADEIIGTSFTRFYKPKDVECGHPEEVLRIAATEGHFEEDGWRVRKDGSLFWANVMITALRDEDGQLRGFSKMTRDITERKETQEKLRESEQQLRALIEGVKDYAILRLDPQGRVASWTACAKRIKGYSADEIIGRSFTCFYTPEEVERGHPEEVLRIVATEGHFEEDGWRVRKDGSLFWANVMITALRDESGRLSGFSKMTRDITERKETQEKLRESEQQLRAVLESAPDAMMIADEEGKIVLINAQTERLFGYLRDELVGQPVEMLIPASGRAHHVNHRSDYNKAPHARRMGTNQALKGLRKDGVEFPIEVSLSPIRTANSSWTAAAVRDVTERRIVELQLVAERQRAEEANYAKSGFLAAMSHEIRTPMNAILGMSDMLAESHLDADQMQYVEVFRRAGANLLTLINDILDLSKIEAGQLELEHVPFDLEEVVDQAIELVGVKTRAKGLALMSRLSPGLSTALVGDPNRLRQVLINLLGNAVKFTEVGKVLLTVWNHESGKSGEVEFSVSDTGIGIPADKLESIFEKFTQADPSTTRKYGGTGLGLEISRRLVERMGGGLTATSCVGEGSTFRFNIQFEERSQSERVASTPVADLHGCRILVIDHNATNRFILGETLNVWGMESNDFGVPAEALESLAVAIAANQPYSLVLVDRDMPAMDGFETATRIKEIAPDLPIIMFTSDVRPGDVLRCQKAGFSGYAVKPVNRGELLRLIAKATRPGKGAASSKLESRNDKETPVKPLRILIAEDSADNRLLVEMYFKGSPHQLTFAEDGSAAVDRFVEGVFDLILMDMQMPIMDGLSATRAIRAIEQQLRSPAIPIIALTANAFPLDVELTIGAGCNCHLSKPISKEKLLSAVEESRQMIASGNAPEAGTPGSIRIEMPEGLEEIVPGYLAARQKELPEMMGLLAASNFERLVRLAHNIKGTGSSYGFPELTRMGAGLELSAKQLDREALSTQLAELKDYLGRVQLFAQV